MTPFLRFIFRSLTLAAAVLTFVMLLARWHWMPDLLTHFRLPCAVGFAVLLMLLLLAKLPKSALLVSVFLIIQIQPLLQHYLPFTKDNRAANGPSFKVLTFNVLTNNDRHSEVLALIQKHDPDFIFLQETSQQWIQALTSLRSTYPYQIEHPRSDNFGILLYSKHPFLNSQIDSSKEFATPLILASVQFRGKKLNLINTHTLPPVSRDTARSNRSTLEKLADEAEGRDAPLLVAGDFNCSAYSPNFRHIGTELRDSAKGRGYPATWKRWHPLLGIPIDQILYTNELVCQTREIGPRTGSDHSPLIATFQFATD